MPSPGQSTFDGNPNLETPTTQGYRPGADDFDGCALEDLPGGNPNPAYMPTAALYNTYGLLLVSVGRMIAWGSCSIIGGAVPSLAYWRVAANNITNGSGTSGSPFTVTRNSAGNLSITYPTGTFPAPMGQPRAFLNVAAPGNHNYSITAINIPNGVQVVTLQDGVPTDLNCSVDFL